MDKRLIKILRDNALDSPDKLIRIDNKNLLKIKGITKNRLREIRINFGPPIMNWPVEDQCNYLDISYRKIRADWDAKGFYKFNWFCDIQNKWVYPEDFVLNFFLAKGWKGVNSEGRFILTLLKLLAQEGLSRRWHLDFFYISKDSYRYASRKIGRPISYHKKRLQDSIKNLNKTTEEELINRFEYCKIIGNIDDSGQHGFTHAERWSAKLIVEAYRALGKKNVVGYPQPND